MDDPTIVDELVDRMAIDVNNRYLSFVYTEAPPLMHIYALLSQHLSIGLKILAWVTLGRAHHRVDRSTHTLVPC